MPSCDSLSFDLSFGDPVFNVGQAIHKGYICFIEDTERRYTKCSAGHRGVKKEDTREPKTQSVLPVRFYRPGVGPAPRDTHTANGARTTLSPVANDSTTSAPVRTGTPFDVSTTWETMEPRSLPRSSGNFDQANDQQSNGCSGVRGIEPEEGPPLG